MEKKKTKKKKGNLKKKILIIILIIIILLGVGYIIYNKIQNRKTNKLLETIKVEPQEGKSERILQLEELQKQNSEIVGWLEIEGTDINYPVLQGTDNGYYMTHDYKKDYSKNGSIFLDKDYDWTKASANLLMYGHNNKNGTMFEELLKYKEESYYLEHPTIKFTSNTEDAEYEIIAVFLSRVYYKSETNVFRYYYFVDANDEQDFNKYVANCKKESLYNIDKTAKYGDQLITLSTCSYHTEDGRFAVVARKVNQGE